VGRKRRWRKRYYTQLVRDKAGDQFTHLPRHVDLYERKIFIFNTSSTSATSASTQELTWLQKAAAVEDAAGGFPPTGRRSPRKHLLQNQPT
jgi:hypothetical protein